MKFKLLLLVIFLALISSATVKASQSDNYMLSLHDYIISIIDEYMLSYTGNISTNVIVNTSNVDLGVKAYGAIGDGITDDTAAIQSAINAAETVNGRVYFPTGDYYISDTLKINKQIYVYGDGDSSQIYQSADKTLFDISNVDHMNMENLFLGSSATSVNTSLILLNNTHGSILRNIRMSGAYYGIWIHGGLLNRIENIVVTTNIITPEFFHYTTDVQSMQAAIYQDTYGAYPPNMNIIDNPRIEGGTYGVFVRGAQTGIINGGTIEGMVTGVGTGVRLDDVSMYRINDLYSEGNVIDVNLTGTSAQVMLSGVYLASESSLNMSANSYVQTFGGSINRITIASGGWINPFGTIINYRIGGAYRGYDSFGNIYQDRNTRYYICKKPDLTLYAC